MELFVYGSLKDPARLDEVLGRRYRGARVPARLDGFQRLRSADYAFPFLVPAEAARVDGLLLVELSEDDLAAIDLYEEVDQNRYRRATVTVTVGALDDAPGSRTLTAQTYLAGPALARSVEGSSS